MSRPFQGHQTSEVYFWTLHDLHVNPDLFDEKNHRWLLGDTASIVVGYKLSIVWGNHPVNLGRSGACLRVKWFEVTIQYQIGGVHFNQFVNHHINLISCFIYLSFCRQASALRTWGTALSPLHGHLLFDWENRLPKGLSFTCQVFPKNDKNAIYEYGSKLASPIIWWLINNTYYIILQSVVPQGLNLDSYWYFIYYIGLNATPWHPVRYGPRVSMLGFGVCHVTA